VAGLLALFGETERAAELLTASRRLARSPLARFSHAFVAALIASSEGHQKEMAQHLRAQAIIVREHAIPLGEASCLIGFAALAVDERDCTRASRLLATVRAVAPFPFRSPLQVVVYRRCADAVRAALDPATTRLCRAEGAANQVSEALDSELERPLPDDLHTDHKAEHS
jgi:hypothetical protein